MSRWQMSLAVVITSRLEQNGRRFADDIFIFILFLPPIAIRVYADL